MIKETKRSPHDALCVCQGIWSTNNSVVYGGGSAEISCSIAHAADRHPGVEQDICTADLLTSDFDHDELVSIAQRLLFDKWEGSQVSVLRLIHCFILALHYLGCGRFQHKTNFLQCSFGCWCMLYPNVYFCS